MRKIEDPIAFRLWEMRKMLNMTEDTSKGEIVRAWYRDAAERSMRLRGFVPDRLWNNAHADLIELGAYSPAEADSWILKGAERYPLSPPVGMVRTPLQEFAAKSGLHKGMTSELNNKALTAQEASL